MTNGILAALFSMRLFIIIYFINFRYFISSEKIYILLLRHKLVYSLPMIAREMGKRCFQII